MNKKSSYLDTLSPAKESPTVKQYDPEKTEGQIGKEHEEEIAAKNNWGNDKRDDIGRAASRKKRIAVKLRRIARELEALNMDEEYQEKIEDAVEQAEDEAKGISAEEMQEEEDDDDDDDEMKQEEEEMKNNKATRDEFIVMEASTTEHPLQDKQSDPDGSMSAQTGDDEWIDIGPGEFTDPRDSIGRAG